MINNCSKSQVICSKCKYQHAIIKNQSGKLYKGFTIDLPSAILFYSDKQSLEFVSIDKKQVIQSIDQINVTVPHCFNLCQITDNTQLLQKIRQIFNGSYIETNYNEFSVYKDYVWTGQYSQKSILLFDEIDNILHQRFQEEEGQEGQEQC